ncbi:hypothetical protein, partial [Ruminococcus bicirculans (ex Wegman et al. 2014)]|uniref:hypothetical protein n=1 Tax=Ruminococcus bicirculans (ex Wegman et al. 2014) TaxID=1160721 RepID=UPI00242C5DDC
MNFSERKNVMQEWLMTITLGIIGVFLIAVTYAALYQSKKSQKHISGFPFFGGFILAVAFLFSPIKWLAFLGFAIANALVSLSGAMYAQY